MLKSSRFVAVAVAALALGGCWYEDDDPQGLQDAVINEEANLTVFGIDQEKATIDQVDLGEGEAAVTIDSTDVGYAGFGFDAGELEDVLADAAPTPKALYKARESETRNAADKLLDRMRKKLGPATEDNPGGLDMLTRFDIVKNQVSRNAQATVVNLEIDLELNSEQGTSILRNLLLRAMSRRDNAQGRQDVVEVGTRYRLTLAVWIVRNRVLSWTGTFLESKRAEVEEEFGDVNSGNAVTDASVTQTLSNSQQFTQAEGNSQVDILWVIDNSGSMSEEQSNLAAGAASFFQLLQPAGLDYHLGVVTTETSSLGYCWELSQLSDQSARFITAQTANAETEWGFISQPGLIGGTETGFFCAEQAYLDPTATNTGFDRAEAPDIVVFVSDEPENESFLGATPVDATTADPAYVAQGLDHYLAYFQAKPVTAFAIVGTGTLPRPTLQDPTPSDPNSSCSGEGGSAGGGANYGEAASQTGGSRASICSPFATWETTFQEVVEAASGLASLFTLDFVPISNTVNVQVNGTAVTRDTSHQNGFDVLFRSDSASIAFYGDAIPQDNDTITVSYDYLEELEEEPAS